MAGAPKKKGALAALLSFGGKSSDTPEEEDGARYSRGEDPEEETDEDIDVDAKSAAFVSFAKAAGIPEERRASAKEALIRFVKACSSTEYEDEEV